MAIGPGKYDDMCSAARDAAAADGVILIVTNGYLGSGFSVEASETVIRHLPEILRQVADQIEEDVFKRDRDLREASGG